MVTRQLTVATLVASTALVVACQNTREGLEKDAEKAAPKIERAAEQTAQAARQVGREIAEVAGPAVEATKEGAAAAGAAVRAGAAEVTRGADAAQQGAQVKAALMADASIDSTTIDVETDADTRTIVLKGHVRSAAEKAQAGRIAADKAPNYRVNNELAVRR